MGAGGDGGGGQQGTSYGTTTANKHYARQTPERCVLTHVRRNKPVLLIFFQ